MTILRQEKPENEIKVIDEFTLLGKERPENVVEERDSVNILGADKEPLQTEYIDELFIERNNSLKKIL